MKLFVRLNVIALAASALLTGCASEAENKLRKAVDETAAQCPIKVAPGVTIDSIDYANDMVTYYTSVTNGMLQIQTLKDETDMVRNLVVEAIRSSDSPEISEQLEMCADAGASIVMAFTDRIGDTFDVRINPKDYLDNNENNDSINSIK